MVLLVETQFICKKSVNNNNTNTNTNIINAALYTFIILILICISIHWIGPEHIFIQDNYLRD